MLTAGQGSKLDNMNQFLVAENYKLVRDYALAFLFYSTNHFLYKKKRPRCFNCHI